MADLAAGGAMGVPFTILYEVIKEVVIKTSMFRPLLEELKSKIEALNPLIAQMDSWNKVLDRPEKELREFKVQMEKGPELITKCANLSKWKSYKKYKYSNQLLELQNSLQNLLFILQWQQARDVKETLVGVKNVETVVQRVDVSVAEFKEEGMSVMKVTLDEVRNLGTMVRRIDKKGEVQNPLDCEVPEPPLVTVGLYVPLRELKMKLLKNDNVSMLVLTAPGGCGKTTLATKFCQDEEVKGIFKNNIFFVTVTKKSTFNLIVQGLHQCKSTDIPMFQDEVTAVKWLRKFLMEEGQNPVLLVLDDVWSESKYILEKFDEVKMPNFKILVTSRSQFPEYGSVYHLKSLNDRDAMTLFRHSASLGDGQWNNPAREIVAPCKGYPLAIKVVGKSLRGKPIEFWRKRALAWSKGDSIIDSETEVLLRLQTSLDALDEKEALIKECFLDLGSFPQDQRIPAGALIDMWAELYEDLDNDFLAITNMYELTTRSLADLVDTRKETVEDDDYYSERFVTQHDLLRQLAVYQAKLDPSKRRLIIGNHGDNLPKCLTEQKHQPIKPRLLSISSDETFSTNLHNIQLADVEVLVLNFNTKSYALPEFVEKMVNLKVLIVTNHGFILAELSNFHLLDSLPNLKRIRLERVSIPSITKHPIQLKSLKKISLFKCSIGKAFSNCFFQISNALANLEELNIDYCNDLVKLPDELCNLVRLKKLSITNCHKLSALPQEIGKLEKVEVLRLRSCTDLVKLPCSVKDLERLDFLDISDCFSIVELPEDIGELSSLRKINMRQCSRLLELPLSILDLQKLEEVICDEETARLWEPFPSGLRDGVVKTERQHIEAIAESVFSMVRPIETEFTMPMGDFQAFEATRQAMDKVMKALEADEVTAIGVYGMGGVGKSTMVEHVCAEVRDNGMFDQVISAVVSQNPDLRKIQGTLADMLGFIFEEETEIGRARRLMQRIRRGNRILVILDNIWERTDLSNIGIPSYYELQRCNSKVLLITRTQNVCRAMECQSNISLDVLSEEDSWTLFVNKAIMSFESTNLCDVAKKVARACAGLPVALIAVAKALGDKCLDDWKEAVRRLEASQPANLEDGKVVFNCIKLSYDYLISDDARSCFLLCCLFPEDYDIQVEELLKYGMGKGLFQDSCTMQDARVTAHLVVKYLKDCSLLLETGQDGCVKMHDVIRDVAIRISLSEDGPLFFVQAGCQLKEWPSISAHEGYSAISLIMNKICKLPEELVCPKLLILFLQSNVWLNEIPEYFFQSLNVLRVLDLSRTRISFLPTSFNILINLQTLYLDGCLSTIDNISILGKLKKLEILSMRELPLVELPKEIRDLSHLRMLDITGDYVDNVPSEVICNLNLLEELYMQCNFADWGSKVEGAGEENIVAFDELTGLSCLNVLKVFISDAKCLPKDVEVEPNWLNFDICISRDPSIRKVSVVSSSSPTFTRALTLDTTINALPGWFINAVTMKAEKLQYIMCWGLDNILVEYDSGRLHALKYLSVIGPNENLKMLMNTVTRFWNEPVFQNLEELHLVQVDCLKELCVGELPPGSLCNLRLLKVKHCYELVDALLPSRLLQRLQNLEELICEEIDELEYVFGCEGLEPEQMILTKLIEMRLENLGKLTKIWNGPAHCAIFQNLQSLVVSRCFELENLFTTDVAQCLLHLEDLSVELCPMLDNIIEASMDTVDNKIVFLELKNLTLIKLPQLTRFCGSTGSAIECPLLEYLYVERCPQFSTSDFHSRNKVQLNHPQHLDIVQRRAQSREKKKNQFH